MTTPHCDWLFGQREEFVEKLEEANEALDELTGNIARTMITLAAAEAAFIACSLASPLPPVAAACAIGAAITIAAIAAELHTYELELENVERARGEAAGAIEQLDGLLSHCRALASWQEDAAIDLLQQAPDPGMIIIPDVDDSAIEELESMLAAIEQPEFDDAYA